MIATLPSDNAQAVVDGELALLRRYLTAGADPNWGDYDGRAPLHVAAAEGSVVAVQVSTQSVF